MTFLFGALECRLPTCLLLTVKRESVKSHFCMGSGHVQMPFFEVLAIKG